MSPRRRNKGGAIIISDLHSHAWPRFATTLEDGTNSRFADLLNVLAQVERYIDEHEPDALIMLGDLTHRRHYVEFGVYNRLLDWIVRMKQKPSIVDVIVVVGNHDIESTGVHSLGPLKHMGVTVIDEPTWIHFEAANKHAFFVPYMHGEAVPDVLRQERIVWPDPWLFLHYAFDGKILDNEYAVPSPLKKSDADAFERIVLGHIHSPSMEDQARITYVGAPLHFDFGDSGERYAWWLDDTMALTALPLEFPRFVTSTYPKIPAPPEASGFLRVLKTPRQMFGDVKKAALSQGWRDALIIEDQIPVEAIRAISNTVMVNDEMVRSYVAQQYPDVDDATRAAIIGFGLDCIRVATS